MLLLRKSPTPTSRNYWLERRLLPAPNRSEIYERIDQILGFPNGRLSRLAEEQRREELKRKAVEPPQAFFKEGRELLLRKCDPAMQKELHRIFQKEAFGDSNA